jgi:hypothetical protein
VGQVNGAHSTFADQPLDAVAADYRPWRQNGRGLQQGLQVLRSPLVIDTSEQRLDLPPHGGVCAFKERRPLTGRALQHRVKELVDLSPLLRIHSGGPTVC